ncbi:helix-turn-helix domain-containing protein [Citrobacter freundii]
MTKHDYSIQDVSTLIGKHKSTISRWVKDKNE